ncbi:MAG: MarR family transcriptional regulator [Actinomycetota bacterium]|nr:MarR family transcriptional regulator [Actinomycetota bacterium]
MTPTLDLYLQLLRAVDGGKEARSPHVWTLTTTGEIAARCGLSRQQATPLLRSMLREGFVTRCEQPGPEGCVTWHLGDRGTRLLLGEQSIVIDRKPGPMSRPVKDALACAY